MNTVSQKIAVYCLVHTIVHQTLLITIAKLLQLLIEMVARNDDDIEFVSNRAKHNHRPLPELCMLLTHKPLTRGPKKLGEVVPFRNSQIKIHYVGERG